MEELHEVPDIWMGSIFSRLGSSCDKDEDKCRDEIIGSISNWFVENFELIRKSLNADGNNPNENIRPNKTFAFDKTGKNIYDIHGYPIVYLKFPKINQKLMINNKNIDCIFGIRINICMGDNLSKVMTYLHPKDKIYLDRHTLFYFFQTAKEKLEHINQIIGKQYEIRANSKYIHYKIRIYNTGVGSKDIKFVLRTNDPQKIAESIKSNTNFEKSYLDIVSLTHGKFFKNYSDYQKNVSIEHDWSLRLDEKNQIASLFAQHFLKENDEHICEYSGLTSSSDINHVHSMTRSLVLDFINEF